MKHNIRVYFLFFTDPPTWRQCVCGGWSRLQIWPCNWVWPVMGSGTEQTRPSPSEHGGTLTLVVVDKCPGASVELDKSIKRPSPLACLLLVAHTQRKSSRYHSRVNLYFYYSYSIFHAHWSTPVQPALLVSQLDFKYTLFDRLLASVQKVTGTVSDLERI